jgi:hypothetical protein
MANGFPEGYTYAESFSDQGDQLVCGAKSWKVVGEAPPGGTDTVAESMDLLSSMTGMTVKPDSEVAAPAVHITFEFVSREEIEQRSEGTGGETIGLAITTHTTFGINHSEILLNQPFFEEALDHNRDEAALVVLHELGHALGLGHTEDPESLMHPTISASTRITDADVVAFNAVAPDC